MLQRITNRSKVTHRCREWLPPATRLLLLLESLDRQRSGRYACLFKRKRTTHIVRNTPLYISQLASMLQREAELNVLDSTSSTPLNTTQPEYEINNEKVNSLQQSRQQITLLNKSQSKYLRPFNFA
jgi:hypothetical protein